MMEQQAAEASPIQLAHEWVFYFDEPSGKGLERKQYEDSLKPLGSCGTVQEFWRYWNNIAVEKFSINSNLRLFKKGIRPSWEDEANERGGRWVIECPQNKTTQAWMLMLLALIGEQFAHSSDLCGAVLAIRHRGNTIQLWNKTSSDPALLKKTEEDIATLLKLGKLAEMRYQVHKASHDWNQSLAKEKQQPTITKSISANDVPAAASPEPAAVTSKPVPNLPNGHQDEDDFESPFHELNKEAQARLSPAAPRVVVSTIGHGLASEPSPTRHRKARSTGDSSGTDLPPVSGSESPTRSGSMTPEMSSKRRLRHRGKRRSSSGSQSLLVPLAFDSILPSQDEGEETPDGSPVNSVNNTPRDQAASSSAHAAPLPSSVDALRGSDGVLRIPSYTERIYIERKVQRQQSTERVKSRRGSLSELDPASLNPTDSAVKRKHFSRGSRDNRDKYAMNDDAPPYAGFCFQVFVLFAIALLVAGYFVQYSCSHFKIGCTYE